MSEKLICRAITQVEQFGQPRTRRDQQCEWSASSERMVSIVFVQWSCAGVCCEGSGCSSVVLLMERGSGSAVTTPQHAVSQLPSTHCYCKNHTNTRTAILKKSKALIALLCVILRSSDFRAVLSRNTAFNSPLTLQCLFCFVQITTTSSDCWSSAADGVASIVFGVRGQVKYRSRALKPEADAVVA